MLSPRTALLLAYLPSRRLAYDARRDLVKRNASTVDPQLKHAIAFSRAGLDVEASLVDETDARLAQLARYAGTVPGQRPALTTPVLEAAWTAGEAARAVSIAVSVVAHIAYLRSAAPDNPDLRTEAAARAKELVDGSKAYQRALETSGLPLMASRAANVPKMIRLTGNLEPTNAAGYKELNQLARDLGNFIEADASKFDVAPPPAPTTQASPEETALVARIIASPGDSGLRRQLAKLANARGDQRGQLIRVQLDGNDDPAQEQNLIKSHPEWTAKLVELGARDIKFGGGFPEEITVDATTWIARGADLVATAPLRRLKVRNAKGRVADVVRSPLLATIETLDLDDQAVGDDDVIALASSPHAARLRRLDLRHNPISERGIDAIAASPHLKGLRALNLDGNPDDPTDRQEYYDETRYHFVATDAGKALEAKYGPLPWLHRG